MHNGPWKNYCCRRTEKELVQQNMSTNIQLILSTAWQIFYKFPWGVPANPESQYISKRYNDDEKENPHDHHHHHHHHRRHQSKDNLIEVRRVQRKGRRKREDHHNPSISHHHLKNTFYCSLWKLEGCQGKGGAKEKIIIIHQYLTIT